MKFYWRSRPKSKFGVFVRRDGVLVDLHNQYFALVWK